MKNNGKKRRSPTATATVEKVVDGTKFKFTITPKKRERTSRELTVPSREETNEAGDFIPTAEMVRERHHLGYSGQKVFIRMPDFRKDIVIVRWDPIKGDYDYWVRVQNVKGELIETTPYTSRNVAHVPTRNLQSYLGEGVQVTVLYMDNLTGDYAMIGSEWFIVPKYEVVDFVEDDEQFRPQQTREEMTLVQKFYCGLGLAAVLAFLFILYRVH